MAVEISNCIVGCMNEEHAKAICALADAARANAEAIKAIAEKANVTIHGDGIHVEGDKNL